MKIEKSNFKLGSAQKSPRDMKNYRSFFKYLCLLSKSKDFDKILSKDKNIDNKLTDVSNDSPGPCCLS